MGPLQRPAAAFRDTLGPGDLSVSGLRQEDGASKLCKQNFFQISTGLPNFRDKTQRSASRVGFKDHAPESPGWRE